MVKKVDWARLLYVGGNANNGSICGLSASNANNGFSNSNANIGARLKFILKTYKAEHPRRPRNWEASVPNMRKTASNPRYGERASRVTLKASSMKDESHSVKAVQA